MVYHSQIASECDRSTIKSVCKLFSSTQKDKKQFWIVNCWLQAKTTKIAATQILITISSCDNAKESTANDDLGLGFDEDEIGYIKMSFSLPSLKLVGQDHGFGANGNWNQLE